MFNQKKILLQFKETRGRTEDICSFLETEDYVVQPVVFVSPPKWHLGHSTWFFEHFVLSHWTEYKVFDSDFNYVFNSYYESVGKKVIRADRGNLTRPTVREIYDYRRFITEHLISYLTSGIVISEKLLEIIELGIHHEKQHQELLITDIKYILGNNPLFPEYNDEFQENPVQNYPQEWIKIADGLYDIGHNPEDGFAFDNEMGRHKTFLHEYEISNRLVTNKEYLEFMEDGGYDQVLLWHSEAWEWLQENGVQAPEYWHLINGEWCTYTLKGLEKINPEAPLSHISYFEAFAFAQWKDMRLPTEFEWEAAQKHFSWGSRWEWTESSYLPYPGFAKSPDALGEYNGKFMVNQKVLRGSSVASPPHHTRPSYRNFFHPQLRWQFTGIRLAKKQQL